MRLSNLLARNLTWYWRTNAAVVFGVAVGAAALGGALLVGSSVRASLHDLVGARLGRVESVVTRPGFLHDNQADVAIIALQGVVSHEASGRRAGAVEIFGVDQRFWQFQNLQGQEPQRRDVYLSGALIEELGAKDGDTVLVRVEKPSAIPLETLHGRKEDGGKTLRGAMAARMPRDFSLRLQQGDVRAVYVPLAWLQRELGIAGKVNMLLDARTPHLTLADAGLKLRELDGAKCWSLESDSTLVADAVVEKVQATARALGLHAQPALTYLAETIRHGERETPYSLVTAIDGDLAPKADGGIVLNEWTARDLNVGVGGEVKLEYLVWKSEGRLDAEKAAFRVERIVPMSGAALDRDFAPEFPGISDTENLRDWDPPFPLDLSRIRDADERYWEKYRTTPKAFITLARGRQLWGSRFGHATSVRVAPADARFKKAFEQMLTPELLGIETRWLRQQGREAAKGSTDFGEYFVYFSFFLVVSALLLTGLFFKLGVEQRMREIGVLRALGYSRAKLRTIFLCEGAVLAGIGSAIGTLLAPVYCALVLHGLRTWWIGASGTRMLVLHVEALPLLYGALAGMATGLGAIAWTLRRMVDVTPRGLMAGGENSNPAGRVSFAVVALAVAGGAAMLAVGQAAGFFGAGALFLMAALTALHRYWRRPRAGVAQTLAALGVRGAVHRPGRSVLCVALVASATFLIVALDAFRRDGVATGEFALLADAALPIVHDPNTAAGREALNVPALEGVEYFGFRVRAGDDASCLNLFAPRQPRILAPGAAFLKQARSPWNLLETQRADGAIPAIADANSLEYALHRKVGDVIDVNGAKLAIVGALEDSVFQGELLISENNFLRLYPETSGFRFFLIKAPLAREAEITGALESALSDYGFDVQSTAARMAAFHRVENTYLATFRALGALGLALGTLGLGAIVMRNVLERRRELALLRAVGYRPRHLAILVLVENALLLALGLGIGTACAMVAAAPVALARGGGVPIASIALLLGVVMAFGVAAAVAATALALRTPLLTALRSE